MKYRLSAQPLRFPAFCQCRVSRRNHKGGAACLLHLGSGPDAPCPAWENGYAVPVALDNVALAEEALSLSPRERANLAKLLIQSLEGTHETDDQIRADLARRLAELLSGSDRGLTFEQVFGEKL